MHEENQYLCDTCGVLYIGHSFNVLAIANRTFHRFASWLILTEPYIKMGEQTLWKDDKTILRRKKPSAELWAGSRFCAVCERYQADSIALSNQP